MTAPSTQPVPRPGPQVARAVAVGQVRPRPTSLCDDADGIEVTVTGPAVLVFCHDDLGDGRALAERVRPRLARSVEVLVVDLHGLGRLLPDAAQVLADLVDRAEDAATTVIVVGDDEGVLDAVRAACVTARRVATVQVRNTTVAG